MSLPSVSQSDATKDSELIRVQQTPNPNALKFVLPRRVFAQPLNISNAGAAAEHPLAARLFALGSVYNVLMAQDFVTVNKLPHIPWETIQRPITSIVTEYFSEQ